MTLFSLGGSCSCWSGGEVRTKWAPGCPHKARHKGLLRTGYDHSGTGRGCGHGSLQTRSRLLLALFRLAFGQRLCLRPHHCTDESGVTSPLPYMAIHEPFQLHVRVYYPSLCRNRGLPPFVSTASLRQDTSVRPASAPACPMGSLPHLCFLQRGIAPDKRPAWVATAMHTWQQAGEVKGRVTP